MRVRDFNRLRTFLEEDGEELERGIWMSTYAYRTAWSLLDILEEKMVASSLSLYAGARPSYGGSVEDAEDSRREDVDCREEEEEEEEASEAVLDER